MSGFKNKMQTYPVTTTTLPIKLIFCIVGVMPLYALCVRGVTTSTASFAAAAAAAASSTGIVTLSAPEPMTSRSQY